MDDKTRKLSELFAEAHKVSSPIPYKREAMLTLLKSGGALPWASAASLITSHPIFVSVVSLILGSVAGYVWYELEYGDRAAQQALPTAAAERAHISPNTTEIMTDDIAAVIESEREAPHATPHSIAFAPAETHSVIAHSQIVERVQASHTSETAESDKRTINTNDASDTKYSETQARSAETRLQPQPLYYAMPQQRWSVWDQETIALSPRAYDNVSTLYPTYKFSYEMSDPTLSITLNTFAVMDMAFLLQAELKRSESISIAALLGIGSPRVSDVEEIKSKPLMYAFGAQINYYFAGNFGRGWQMGAQALYVDAPLTADVLTFDKGRSFAVTPYVGYKMALGSGLTINAQAGFGFGVREQLDTAPLEGSIESTGVESRWSTYINMGIGWSL